MSGPNVNSTLYPHKCRNRINQPLSNQYCSFCGIFISDDPSVVYLRPPSFSSADSYIADQNLVIANMIKKQTIHLYYDRSAFHVPFRPGLVDWLEKTARKLGLNSSTVHLSVAILDIVLSAYSIPYDKMEVMVFTVLNMAGKMEDRDDRLPCLKDVPVYFQKAMRISELIACEKIVFEVLGYNANIQTPYRFARQFISYGVISNQDIDNKCTTSVMNEFERLMSLFTLASLKNYDLCQFEASIVGSATIAATRKALGFSHIWTDHLERLTRVSWSRLHPCLKILENTAIEIYGDETVARDIQPTPIKRKFTFSVVTTNDKGYELTPSDKDNVTGKQVFVSRFSFSNNQDCGDLKNVVVDDMIAWNGKEL